MLALALFLVFAAVSIHRPAYAGALHIRDDAHVLSADDAARLRSVVASAPFDARFVTSGDYPDSRDLSRYVGSLVTEPNMVVVGLDPQHHHVQVHFGTGSHVSPAERPAVEQAGNEAFRRHDWEGGAAAIFNVAARAVTGASADPAPVVASRPALFGPGLLLLLVGGAIAVGIYFARRRATVGPVGGPVYGPPPYGGGYGPGYGPGYPPPQGGMGPLGGGLLGAGLGGLAGYELGKLEGEREGRLRDDPGAGRAEPEGRDENYDAGGGGSSWDDDGGGDGGGGFDAGGGDGGGGGSDFGA
jgi:uncharacterized membrane protein YgcG